jgi:hypothetical protein
MVGALSFGRGNGVLFGLNTRGRGFITEWFTFSLLQMLVIFLNGKKFLD